MSDPERVAVVGGGAVGVTAAHELAGDGVDVTLFERDELAAGASGRAAGICYDAFAERIDADVAARAMARFCELADGTRLPFTARPYVWLARTGDDRCAEAIREQVPRMQAHGRDVELLAASELADRFPALETSDVAVAAIAHDAACTDPAKYTAVVTEQARAAGTAVRTDTPVTLESGPSSEGTGPTLETPAGRETFDAVLVAAGAHTKQLFADAGVSLPVKPYRVQALVTESTAASADAPMLYDATRSFYCRPEEGGFLVGDGTEPHEFDPDDYDPTADESFVADALAQLQDALGSDVVAPTETRRAWAGLCTATPDRDPLLGAVSPDVYVATGWHGHGFMRAPALGATIAGQIRGENGIEPFDPARFDGDEEFQVVEGMTVD